MLAAVRGSLRGSDHGSLRDVEGDAVPLTETVTLEEPNTRMDGHDGRTDGRTDGHDGRTGTEYSDGR